MPSQNRAIVMEICGRRAVVMTANGAFRRMRVTGPLVVGQEISLGSARRFNWKSIPARSAIAGLAAVVVLGVGVGQELFGTMPKAEAYAFVSVDVNPSVSFDLDSSMHVIKVYGTNANGTSLAHRLRLQVRGKPIDVAIRDMMAEVSTEGKLSQHSPVIVAASSPSGKVDLSNSVQTAVTADVHKALQSIDEGNPVSAKVYSMNVTNSVWSDAVKKKVSPGQYASYLLGNEAGVNVKLSQVKSPNAQLAVAQAHDLKSSVKALNNGNAQSVSAIVQSAVQRVSQQYVGKASQIDHGHAADKAVAPHGHKGRAH